MKTNEKIREVKDALAREEQRACHAAYELWGLHAWLAEQTPEVQERWRAQRRED